MRGSGTEPVFRISVDVEGDKPELFGYLIDWQTSMVGEADSIEKDFSQGRCGAEKK